MIEGFWFDACDKSAEQLDVCATDWAIDGVNDFTLVPFPSATRLVYSGGFGEAGEEPIHNARWADLWVAADRLVRRSGDAHHRYIEKISPLKDDPTTLELWAGS